MCVRGACFVFFKAMGSSWRSCVQTVYTLPMSESKHNALREICIAEFVCRVPEGTVFIRRGAKWPKKKMFLEEVFHKKKEIEKEVLLEVNIKLSFSAAYSDEWIRKNQACIVSGQPADSLIRESYACLHVLKHMHTLQYV